MRADAHAPPGHYEKLKEEQPAGVGAWYFEHEGGALWIASGGEHAEPVTDWLHDAHLVFRCTTMLAAVLDNGATSPPADAFFFHIRRRDISAVHEKLLRDSFTVYLPHCDEFLIFTPFARYWEADEAHILRSRVTVNARLAFDPPPPRPPRPGEYDPIEAQIREVLGSVSETARQAATDLASDWEEILGPPVPADIGNLKQEIEREKHRVRDLWHGARKTGADISSEIDQYAHSLKSMRRAAFDLRNGIRDYEWPPRQHATYESVATPLMLRALQRYAADLAAPLGIDRYLLPLIGEEFGALSVLPPAPAGAKKTEPIEVPPEIRLRLGALPMIAHPVVRLMDAEVGDIANAIGRISANEQPWIAELRLHILGRDEQSISFEDLHARMQRSAREIAADLLAAAVAGPPYVFAMARFAVGNLGESLRGPVPAGDRPPFRLRLAIVLGALEALGHITRFNSSYYSHAPVELPDSILAVVRKATANILPVDEPKIVEITTCLKTGRVATGRPTEIVTALWRAVAGRTGYLNEIAALVSVATSDMPGAP